MRYRFLYILIILFFISSLVIPIPNAHADSLLGLPEPGAMVNLSPAYEPMLIKGLKVHPENPFLFDFIIDTGSEASPTASSSSKLIKYFLAAMTVPEKDLWVNLSPYEKHRIIASNLAQTDMGRDMLAQDYILKQLTASLIYPERDLGKIFWDEVYTKARLLYGTTDISVDTFNKVWIVPDKADIYEHGNTAYIIGAHLRVMLEEDYLALSKHQSRSGDVSANISSAIVRQIILPQIEQEVNKGRNFAPLRQMFYSMILASWYKMALKDAILTQIYGNQSKVKVGINQADPHINQEIFNRYLRAYKKGVFNYIKQDIDPASQQSVPRKYFSGGTNFAMLAEGGILHRFYDPAQIPIGDYLPGTNGKLWDAAMTVHPAVAVPRNPNPVKTVVWLSKEGNNKGIVPVSSLRKYLGTGTILDPLNRQIWLEYSPTEVFLKAKIRLEKETVQGIAKGDMNRLWPILQEAQQGIPEVRYTRVRTLTVGPQEEEVFLNGIKENKAIVILPEHTVQLTQNGNVTLEKLSETIGMIPHDYLGKKVVLSSNVREVLTDFNAKAQDLPESIKKAQEIAIRVNDIFIVRIFDEQRKSYMYVLPFNYDDQQNGRLKISAFGGGVQFLEGGLKYYKDHVDPTIRTIPGEKNEDARVIIQGKNLNKMLHELNKNNHIENNGNRELIEEFDGETGLFRWNVAKSRFAGIDFDNSPIGETSLNPFKEKNSIWMNVSPTEVRLKPNLNLTKEMVRKIAKGDFYEIWTILNNELNRKLIPKEWFSSGDAAMLGVGGHADQVIRIIPHLAPVMIAPSQTANGGIDFNSSNMSMSIQHDDHAIEMNFDPATIQRIKTQGFDGLEFRIQSILPFTQLTF